MQSRSKRQVRLHDQKHAAVKCCCLVKLFLFLESLSSRLDLRNSPILISDRDFCCDVSESKWSPFRDTIASQCSHCLRMIHQPRSSNSGHLTQWRRGETYEILVKFPAYPFACTNVHSFSILKSDPDAGPVSRVSINHASPACCKESAQYMALTSKCRKGVNILWFASPMTHNKGTTDHRRIGNSTRKGPLRTTYQTNLMTYQAHIYNHICIISFIISSV